VIEIHESLSWDDALAYFLDRLHWILKGLQMKQIKHNSDEIGIHYIKLQVGLKNPLKK